MCKGRRHCGRIRDLGYCFIAVWFEYRKWKRLWKSLCTGMKYTNEEEGAKETTFQPSPRGWEWGPSGAHAINMFRGPREGRGTPSEWETGRPRLLSPGSITPYPGGYRGKGGPWG